MEQSVTTLPDKARRTGKQAPAETAALEVARGTGFERGIGLRSAVAQVVALTVLRRRQPNLPRPYRQWLYPLPSLVALGGWIYVYTSSGSTPIIFSLVILAAGLVAFFAWAKAEGQWPFGAKHVHEDFLEAAERAEQGAAA